MNYLFKLDLFLISMWNNCDESNFMPVVQNMLQTGPIFMLMLKSLAVRDYASVFIKLIVFFVWGWLL